MHIGVMIPFYAKPFVVSQTLVTNGLIGYWNSKQGVNGTAWKNIAPSTSGQYDATLSGAAVQSNGMYLDGNGAYINIPIPTELQSVSPATFEFRLNLTATQTNSAPDLLSDSRYIMYAYQANVIRLSGIFDSVRNQDVRLSVPNMYASDVDSFITITADPATNVISIYKNGTKINSYNPTSLGIPGTVSTILAPAQTILRLGSKVTNYPQGVIDNVRLYNRVLSDPEISQNYAIGKEIGL